MATCNRCGATIPDDYPGPDCKDCTWSSPEPDAIVAVSESTLRKWRQLLKSIDPPEVTYHSDLREMAHEAVELCMERTRVIARDIDELLT